MHAWESSEARVDAVLAAIAMREPPGSDLGTPELFEPPEFQELEQFGPGIVDHLVDLSRRADPRIGAYAVMLLGRLANVSQAGDLQDICDQYNARPDKGPWDYAVIGQCQRALRAIRARHPGA